MGMRILSNYHTYLIVMLPFGYVLHFSVSPEIIRLRNEEGIVLLPDSSICPGLFYHHLGTQSNGSSLPCCENHNAFLRGCIFLCARLPQLPAFPIVWPIKEGESGFLLHIRPFIYSFAGQEVYWFGPPISWPKLALYGTASSPRPLMPLTLHSSCCPPDPSSGLLVPVVALPSAWPDFFGPCHISAGWSEYGARNPRASASCSSTKSGPRI